MILKTGTLVDATLVKAAVDRPPPGEGTASDKDPDAAFTRRHQKDFFGYKAHVGVDQGSELIRTAILTPASMTIIQITPLHLNPKFSTLGEIEEQGNNTPGVLDLPPFAAGLILAVMSASSSPMI